MAWPQILVGVVTILYTLTSVGYLMGGNWQQSLIFFGYAVANIGLLSIK